MELLGEEVDINLILIILLFISFSEEIVVGEIE